MTQIRENIPLKNYSNYKIGGPARYFFEIKSKDEIVEILKKIKNEKIFILGGGTNVLIDDKGFNGLVIHNKIEGLSKNENNIEVGSGVLIKDLLKYCIDNSLSGLEWAGGLPGTIGGAVRGNAGAFKGEIKDNVLEVESINLSTFEIKDRANKDCNFSYRNSIFKEGEGREELITKVTLFLKEGSKEEIKKSIQEKIDYRNARHPMEYPNIGSTFKNIPLSSLSSDLQKEFSSIVKTDPFPVVPTTKLLALCNLKGKKIGGAMISEKHPNFIVNVDNATSEDVKALINIAKDSLKAKFGINPDEEIMYIEN